MCQLVESPISSTPTSDVTDELCPQVQHFHIQLTQTNVTSVLTASISDVRKTKWQHPRTPPSTFAIFPSHSFSLMKQFHCDKSTPQVFMTSYSLWRWKFWHSGMKTNLRLRSGRQRRIRVNLKREFMANFHEKSSTTWLMPKTCVICAEIMQVAKRS